MDVQDVGRMAKEAYAKYPVYKWFYDKMGIGPEELEKGNIPVIDKYDFFEYEDEKGVPYYLFEGLDLKDPTYFTARTSGTTGRPLEMLHQQYNPAWTSGIRARLSKLLEQGQLRCLYPGETSEHMQNLYTTKGSDFVKVFLPKGSLEEKLAFLKEVRPKVVMDITTDIVRYFIKNNVNLAEYGLQYVVYIRMEPSLRETLKSQGLTPVSVFGGLDSGVAAVECPLHETKKHLYAPDCYYEVLADEGEIVRTGTGLLVCTIPCQPFPLIRYCNRDRVQLSESHCDCGYEGRDFTFLGREHGVKIPTAEEIAIDYEKVFETFMDKPFADKVMTALMDVEEEGAPKNILVTFIECGVKEPKLDKLMSAEVMWAGSGTIFEKHLNYLPVIYVPAGTIPWTSLGRIKSYVKLTADASKENMEKYGHYIDIVEKVTPWRIKKG